jgi:hypothetical protein
MLTDAFRRSFTYSSFGQILTSCWVASTTLIGILSSGIHTTHCPECGELTLKSPPPPDIAYMHGSGSSTFKFITALFSNIRRMWQGRSFPPRQLLGSLHPALCSLVLCCLSVVPILQGADYRLVRLSRKWTYRVSAIVKTDSQ